MITKRKPTVKHKQVFKKVCKGMSIKGAMLEEGYSKSTACNSTKLTSTQGWKYLMEKHLSDEKLAQVHDEGLKATKTYKSGEETITDPDYAVRHKYLDTAYKIKNKYPTGQEGNTFNILVYNDGQRTAIAERALRAGKINGEG